MSCRQICIFIISWVFLLTASAVLPAFAQSSLFVASEGTRLMEKDSITSDILAEVPLGTEVTILEAKERWYRVTTPDGETGWIYRGRLAESPPADEVLAESEDLFAGMDDSSTIEASKADTARSIRGLSPETETYAENQNTPAEYRKALEKVLKTEIKTGEIDSFLKQGHIGPYAGN